MPKVLWGADPHGIPARKDLSEINYKELAAFYNRETNQEILCWLIDGLYHPAVFPAAPYDRRYIVCGAYKTVKGFKGWLTRFYPAAELIEGSI